jgi:hypothetical protein
MIHENRVAQLVEQDAADSIAIQEEEFIAEVDQAAGRTARQRDLCPRT